MSERMITAVELARDAGLDPKWLRQNLRDEGLAWYRPGPLWRWEAPAGSTHLADMKRVADRLARR